MIYVPQEAYVKLIVQIFQFKSLDQRQSLFVHAVFLLESIVLMSSMGGANSLTVRRAFCPDGANNLTVRRVVYPVGEKCSTIRNTIYPDGVENSTARRTLCPILRCLQVTRFILFREQNPSIFPILSLSAPIPPIIHNS